MKTILIAKGGTTDGMWISEDDVLTEISKRDDLIQRMFNWIISYTYLAPHDTGARMHYDVLCEDAQNMMETMTE